MEQQSDGGGDGATAGVGVPSVPSFAKMLILPGTLESLRPLCPGGCARAHAMNASLVPGCCQDFTRLDGYACVSVGLALAACCHRTHSDLDGQLLTQTPGKDLSA